MLALALAVALAAHTPTPGLASTAPANGLISTAQFTVRAVVVDRCRVGTDGATCDGAAPTRPVSVRRASQVEITF